MSNRNCIGGAYLTLSGHALDAEFHNKLTL